jgi:Holliday junction resolvase RusA-like endonuclease
MKVFKITFPGKPFPQPRDRSVVVWDARTGRHTARHHTTNEQKQMEARYQAFLLKSELPPITRKALVLGLKFYLPIPKSKSAKWKRNALRGLIRPTSRPDFSNYTKFIEDAFNGFLWVDDSQIVQSLPGSGKYYSANPRTELTLVTWEEYYLASLKRVEETRSLQGDESKAHKAR